ncbi:MULTISPECIES: redoxin family protein [unclassified Micromonospora]|uniref:TlpA family protein disulfide reductase n=1 Tax=unclassified Micromonospora TaxID=2617518 RepID=UPI001C215251|nr:MULTISPECIES: redoxin family protein [unclassified Micromonospora]MBU8856415.1 redoxin domain-containing protein [Micromonospora sp. WMMB482]MDM4782025.1 redoxin domain-containing protein [Micromonospora sp. b486]
MRTAVRVTAAAVLALAAAPACAAGPEPGTQAGAVAPASPAAASPSGSASGPASASTAAVPAALSFTGKTLDGTAFDAAALAGRPVVLWFWAPWCATCASQAWTVAEIAPAYRDTVPIVGVAGLGEQKAMKSFVTEFDLGGTTQIDDRTGALWRRFKVAEQSTFVVLDRTGRVVRKGFLDGEALTRQVETLARE